MIAKTVIQIHHLRHHLEAHLQYYLLVFLQHFYGLKGGAAGEDLSHPGDSGLDQLNLHESISECEDGIVDVLLDVVGDILEHHVHVFDVGVPGHALLDGGVAELSQQVEG